MNVIRIAALAACSISLSAAGQVGLRFSFLNYAPVEAGCNFHLVAGFDADMSKRSAMGLDLSTSIDIFGGAESNVENFEHDGFEVSLSPITRSWSLSLRSMYFLTNDNAGVYIATTIGYRSVSVELLPYVQDNGFWGPPSPAWARPTEHQVRSLQLGLRLGARSWLDGLFSDLYIGTGVNLGDLGSDLPVYMRSSEWDLKRMFFQVGYATGIGW